MYGVKNMLFDISQTYPDDSIDCHIANSLLKLIVTSPDISKINSEYLTNYCNCSKSTISRFCKKIGLSNFYELKYLLSNEAIMNSSKFKSITQQSNDENMLQSYIDDLFKNLYSRIKNLDYELINLLVDDIHNYSNVIIGGSAQSNDNAINLQYNLYNCGKLTYIKNKLTDQKELILNSDSNTLVIIFSISGMYLERISLNKHNMNVLNKPKIYLITCNNDISNSLIDKYIRIKKSSNFIINNLLLEIISSLITITFYSKYTYNNS